MHFTSEELIAITAVANAVKPFGWCLLTGITLTHRKKINPFRLIFRRINHSS